MHASLPTLDALLNAHAEALGSDFEPYRNHAYRVANLCLAQSAGNADQIEKISIAAAFHDLGIWTAHTFDYLQPSVALASTYLSLARRTEWIDEISTMILEHHKVFAYHGNGAWLVEPFRRADWADVSLGLVTFGVSRTLLGDLVAKWPRLGFHKRLVQLEVQQLRTHPWHPLPMVKL